MTAATAAPPTPSTTPPAGPPVPLDREVRLGIVLYGGVSLAIYINGVVQEFARVVRGQRSYRWVKALTDSDVVVDVISGASAGGINGIALAHALTNELDLQTLPRLWREHGDISSLLQDPGKNSPPLRSLLDGDEYQRKLQQAYDDLATSPYQPEKGSQQYISRGPELDLFITGTSLDGQQFVEFDDRGHAFTLNEHRVLFWIKHREGRKEELAIGAGQTQTELRRRATLHQALAKLSRITSGFPGAFPAVHVGAADPAAYTPDGLLHRWGQIPQETPGYYVDGGVLDNKPFTSTLGAIFSRVATRDVERMLFFVDPDPGAVPVTPPEGGAAEPSVPNFGQTLFRARINVPFVETITDDLKALADHNRKVETYNRIVTGLSGDPLQPTVTLMAVQGTRAFNLNTMAMTLSPIYDRSRLVDVSQNVARALYGSIDPRHRPPQANDPTGISPSDRAAAFVRAFDDWIDTHPSERQRVLDSDIFFQRRRVEHVLGVIRRHLHGDGAMEAPPANAQVYEQLRLALNWQVELHEVLRGALDLLVSDAPGTWRDAHPGTLWPAVLEASARLLNLADTQLPQTYYSRTGAALDTSFTNRPQELKDLFAALRAFVTQLYALSPQALAAADPPADCRPMLARLQQYEERLIDQIAGPGDAIRTVYDEFRVLDMTLFPLELVGRLGERDVVEIVRISAVDAKRGFSQRDFEQKLSGDSVMHFGGFFKRSWRSNDILWGRLDGCCQLIECLLDPRRVRMLTSNATLRGRMYQRFFVIPPGDVEYDPAGPANWPWRPEMSPDELFQHARPETRAQLDAWLRALLAGKQVDYESFLNLLIAAEQLEILFEEVPNVVGDALVEQEMWNRWEFGFPGIAPLPSPGPNDDPPRPKRRYRDIGVKRLDPFVAITAAASFVRTNANQVFVNPPRRAAQTDPTKTGMGTFFVDGYTVGGEELTKDIPTVALLGILSRTLLVLRTCLVNMFGDAAPRVQSSLLYRFGLDWPLRAFHGFTLLWRRWPGAKLAAFVGAFILSALLLAIGLLFWSQIIWPDDKLYLNRFIIFIVVPAIVLFLQFQVMVLGAALARWWKMVVFVLLTGVALALLVTGILDIRAIWDDEGSERRYQIISRLVLPALFLYLVTRITFWRVVDAVGRGVRRILPT